MPSPCRHVIEFLALRRSEAVPQHLGTWARSRDSATLLFMVCLGLALCLLCMLGCGILTWWRGVAWHLTVLRQWQSLVFEPD